MNPKDIARLITEDPDAVEDDHEVPMQEYDKCPVCGSERAIKIRRRFACDNKYCQNYDEQYSNFVNLIAWWKFEIGIAKSHLPEIFNMISEAGGKVIDVVGPLEFIAVVPTKEKAEEIIDYIDNDRKHVVPDEYTAYGGHIIAMATPQEQKSPDISGEWIQMYEDKLSDDITNIARTIDKLESGEWPF